MCALPRSAALRLRRCAGVHGSIDGSGDFGLGWSPVSPGLNGALGYAVALGEVFNPLKVMSGAQLYQRTS